MTDGPQKKPKGLVAIFRRGLFGTPRNVNDPRIFHTMALLPFMAWVGLGADGLSSSAYGPEAAFLSIGSHSYLAVFVGLATALTVFIISFAYSKIIEHFPHGGGGYVVASHLIGRYAGLVSGCALIVDYILTIAVSITACVDALGSFLPLQYQHYKIYAEAGLVLLLIVLNIRGVKESVKILMPIFVVFLLTHAALIAFGLVKGFSGAAGAVAAFGNGTSGDFSAIGFGGIALIFFRAYSLGGGTYTGIEAVSNGLQIIRQPTVRNGKRTMIYMAVSLAVTALGLIVCYFLGSLKPEVGKTLNAVLAGRLFGESGIGGAFALVTLVSEGALLLVAAQAGFIDAPRVMANMAVDSWLPSRFAAYSERLTMQNGVVLIGGAALVVLLYAQGSVEALIVMYAINVFLTFSLSQFAMLRRAWKARRTEARWLGNALVHLLGLALCLSILVVTVIEKFTEGGWVTLAVTAAFVVVCLLIRFHYTRVQREAKSLDTLLAAIPRTAENDPGPVDPAGFTAIQLVGGYSGLGVHTLLGIARNFPGLYRNVVFVSVAVIDQGLFKGGASSVEESRLARETDLKKYVETARALGFASEFRLATGTDVVESAVDLCLECRRDFPRSTVFSGRLVFRSERFYHRLLHNETAYAVQRRLQWNGVTNVVLPIRMGM